MFARHTSSKWCYFWATVALLWYMEE
ncbi:hypothetical protein E2C01_029984 [Portunus trituberculatus]|uniref:Uncharacterized protein n=1 Tax=Portunus trituberculatus TaxID=210409 RepID=A0A5B7EQU6_PORTR|nr:hypothetical protein [Portunus trituberculatus]